MIYDKIWIKSCISGKNFSKARHENKKYSYLLKKKIFRYPNQVWSTALTYIKSPIESVYLMAIIDSYSRKTLKLRIFNIERL